MVISKNYNLNLDVKYKDTRTIVDLGKSHEDMPITQKSKGNDSGNNLDINGETSQSITQESEGDNSPNNITIKK